MQLMQRHLKVFFFYQHNRLVRDKEFGRREEWVGGDYILTNHRPVAPVVTADLVELSSPRPADPFASSCPGAESEPWRAQRAAAMAHRRTLRVNYNKSTNVVCVVGSELNVNLDR